MKRTKGEQMEENTWGEMMAELAEDGHDLDEIRGDYAAMTQPSPAALKRYLWLLDHEE